MDRSKRHRYWNVSDISAFTYNTKNLILKVSIMAVSNGIQYEANMLGLSLSS